jgi:threonine synthase
VASDVLRRTLREGEQGLFLATAHPAKFETTRAEGEELPPALAQAAARPILARPMPADASALRQPLLDLANRLRS